MKAFLKLIGAAAIGFAGGCLAMHCSHLQSENDALTEALADPCYDDFCMCDGCNCGDFCDARCCGGDDAACNCGDEKAAAAAENTDKAAL